MDRKKERGESGGEKASGRAWGQRDGWSGAVGRGFREQEVRYREGGGMGSDRRADG